MPTSSARRQPPPVCSTDPADLRTPQARLLATLMPPYPEDPPLEWPLQNRKTFSDRAGYTGTSGSVTRALNGIRAGNRTSGAPHPGLLARGLVEEVPVDAEGIIEICYRITPAGIRAYQAYIATHGPLPEVKDAALCTNDRYQHPDPIESQPLPPVCDTNDNPQPRCAMPTSNRPSLSTNGQSKRGDFLQDLPGLAANIAALMSGSASPIPGNENTPPGASPPDAGTDGTVRTDGTAPQGRTVTVPGRDGGDRTDGRDSQVREAGGLVGEVYGFLADRIALPLPSLVAMSTWVVAAYLADLWDRFPHLGVYSPEKRCGKTTLLELLEKVCPGGSLVTNTSPPALFRKIGVARTTLLLDEAQSLQRRGSESSEVLLDLFCGSISKDAKVCRCAGPDHTPTDFPIYCPKVFALIGLLGGVLGDRCLPLLMERVTKEEKKHLGITKCRHRVTKDKATSLVERLLAWSLDCGVRNRMQAVYDGHDGKGIEPFDVDNDRLADLLTPLQAVLVVIDKDSNAFLLDILKEYALGVDEQAKQAEYQTDGVKLLIACREIFATAVIGGKHGPWNALPADNIIVCLVGRADEKWSTYRRERDPITREALASLLRPYGIKSEFNKERTGKLYYVGAFKTAWAKYCPSPPLGSHSNRSIPSNPSGNGGGA